MINSVWWVGVVENRIDPLKLGRCQVRIFGHHTENKQELKVEDLPWAHPVLPLNNTNPYAPKEGETVTGFFMDGEDAQFPVMVGVLSGIPVAKANETLGFNDPRTAQQLANTPIKPEVFGETATKYPRALDEPTTPRVARNESMDKSQFKQKMNKVIQGSPEAPKKPKTIYPYNNVYESESGHLFEMDDTFGDERVQLYHRSGSYIEYAADGSVTEKIETKKSETVRAGSTLYVGENLTVIVKGDVNYQVDGDFTVSCKKFSVGAKEDIGMSAGKSASLSATMNIGISAKGWATMSAWGFLSLSGKMKADLSSMGPVMVSSKAFVDIGAPLVTIGIAGAAIPASETECAIGAFDESLLSELGESAASSIADTAGSFFSSTWDSIGGWAGGLTDIGGLSGSDFFGGLSDTLSSGGILGDLTSGISDAFQNLGSFGDLASGFGDALSSIGDAIQASSLLEVIGTVNSAISDPLGFVMDSPVFNDMFDSVTNSIGDSIGGFFDGLSFGDNGLGGGFSFDDLKEGFEFAKDAYDFGRSVIDNPLGALSSLAGAADILGQAGGGFVDGLREAAFALNDFIGSTAIGQSFSQIQNALTSSVIAVNDAISAIDPIFGDFLGSAKQTVFDSMPQVDGIGSVLDRVASSLSTDYNVRYGLVDLVRQGKEGGLNNFEITNNLQGYMNTTFMQGVQSEIRNSPITFLNLIDSTESTVRPANANDYSIPLSQTYSWNNVV